MPKVQCTIESCKYWKDNECTAEQILVSYNPIRMNVFQDAKKKEQTLCASFELKESENHES